ncbi:uncharacterized protein ATC70_000647 [Mucor velutinosus]|uniref:Uncharacterized protein n=1 Tax=Mucor velutinosus TaxID=708070 RepID=A0AAN7I194_9FUNG|nr:hypothetical protein ATC70_000647 [Mucor velutinosus]
MMVDELSLMSDRVRRMMDEEASATLKKSDKLYSGPLTSNTTIYPGSTAYLNLLSGRGNFQEKNDKMTHAEVASRAAAFLFDVPSLKLDTSSRRGFKNFLDSTPIFRKRTVDSSDDGYLKEAGCFESSSWKTPDAFNVVSSREATNDTTSESSSNQHPHILRTTSNVKIYFQ